MSTRLTGKKAVGKRLGFVALAFAAIFFASSIEVYRDGKAESKAKAQFDDSAAAILDELEQTSRSAVIFQLWSRELKSSELAYPAGLKNAGTPHPLTQDGRLKSEFVFMIGHSGRSGENRHRAQVNGDRYYRNELPHYSFLSLAASTDVLHVFKALARADSKKAVAYAFSADGRILVTSINDSYEKALADFASAVRIEKRDSSLLFYSPDGRWISTRASSNSIDDYSYDRLFLESQRRWGRLSRRAYETKIDQLLREYATKLPASDPAGGEANTGLQLTACKQQIDQLKEEVASLNRKYAEAEGAALKWQVSLAVSVLALLIALPTKFVSIFVSLRNDRRQAREAELILLRRREMEQNIILKGREISERSGGIIIPTSQEVKEFSRAVRRDGIFNRGRGPDSRRR